MPRGPHTSFLSSHYTFSAQHPTISVPKSCKASEAGPTLNIGVFSCKAFKNQHLLLEPRLLAQIAACVQCCFQRGPADKPEKLYSVFLRMGSNNYLVHTSKVTITWICLTNLEKKRGEGKYKAEDPEIRLFTKSCHQPFPVFLTRSPEVCVLYAVWRQLQTLNFLFIVAVQREAFTSICDQRLPELVITSPAFWAMLFWIKVAMRCLCLKKKKVINQLCLSLSMIHGELSILKTYLTLSSLSVNSQFVNSIQILFIIAK